MRPQNFFQCVCVCVSYVEYASTQGHWKYYALYRCIVTRIWWYFMEYILSFCVIFCLLSLVHEWVSRMLFYFFLQFMVSLNWKCHYFSLVWMKFCDVTRIRLYAKVQFRDLHFWCSGFRFDSIWFWAENVLWAWARACETRLWFYSVKMWNLCCLSSKHDTYISLLYVSYGFRAFILSSSNNTLLCLSPSTFISLSNCVCAILAVQCSIPLYQQI